MSDNRVEGAALDGPVFVVTKSGGDGGALYSNQMHSQTDG